MSAVQVLGGRPVDLEDALDEVLRRYEKSFQYRKADWGLYLIDWTGPGVPDAIEPGWWLAWDNGGEWGVERANDESTRVFIPASSDRITLDRPTMAYRLLRVFRGEEIDFDHREPPLPG